MIYLSIHPTVRSKYVYYKLCKLGIFRVSLYHVLSLSNDNRFTCLYDVLSLLLSMSAFTLMTQSLKANCQLEGFVYILFIVPHRGFLQKKKIAKCADVQTFP